MLNRKINTSKNLGIVETDGPADPDASQLAPESTTDDNDTSPAISSLTVQVSHPHGQVAPQADIVARICAPDGWHNKRLILTGHLTANRLAEALSSVADW